MKDAVEVKALSEAEFMARMHARPKPSTKYFAFYSSIVGGVVTDPALMTVPIDDHFVHRGHAVFDTATLSNGHVYRLGAHLDRFIESARLARIPVCIC